MPPTVLIVDDHPSFRLTARALLEAEGFDVVGEAEDGETALEEAARLHPEVVLLDVQLPGIDGFEVAARLTSNGSSPAVVLTSSRDATEFSGLVERSGARGFVPKAELSAAALDGSAEVRPLRRPWVAVLPAGLAAGGIALALVVTSNHDDTAVVGRAPRPAARLVVHRQPGLRAGRGGRRTAPAADGRGRLRRGSSARLLRRTRRCRTRSGLAVGALSLAVFIHLLFAFPNGRLESRARARHRGHRVSRRAAREPDEPAGRLDADRTSCPKCPSNAFLVIDSDTRRERAHGLLEPRGRRVHDRHRGRARRRWRASTAPARRVLAPVYVGGLASVLLVALGFALTADHERRSTSSEPVGIIAFMSVPFLFLAGPAADAARAHRGDAAPPGDGREPAARRGGGRAAPPAQRPDASLARSRRRAAATSTPTAAAVEAPEESAAEAVTPLEYEGEPIAARRPRSRAARRARAARRRPRRGARRARQGPQRRRRSARASGATARCSTRSRTTCSGSSATARTSTSTRTVPTGWPCRPTGSSARTSATTCRPRRRHHGWRRFAASSQPAQRDGRDAVPRTERTRSATARSRMVRSGENEVLVDQPRHHRSQARRARGRCGSATS